MFWISRTIGFFKKNLKNPNCKKPVCATFVLSKGAHGWTDTSWDRRAKGGHLRGVARTFEYEMCWFLLRFHHYMVLFNRQYRIQPRLGCRVPLFQGLAKCL
jgi:hypothetical protein